MYSGVLTRPCFRPLGRADPPEWAGQVAVRAMAGLIGKDIVIVNDRQCTDAVVVYPCDGQSKVSQWKKWEHDIVPRLRRQQRGDDPPMVQVRVPKSDHPVGYVTLPERDIVVLVYNGVNHYDGTKHM